MYMETIKDGLVDGFPENGVVYSNSGTSQKQKLRKFTNLQRQSRELEPMKPEETKYIQELLRKIDHENISRTTRGSLRPQYI